MQIQNIMRVCDISKTDVTPETLEWLKDHIDPDYRDNVMTVAKENIYSTNALQEEDSIPRHIYNQVSAILELCRINDIPYFRIINE
jgi:hypothetical protein